MRSPRAVASRVLGIEALREELAESRQELAAAKKSLGAAQKALGKERDRSAEARADAADVRRRLLATREKANRSSAAVTRARRDVGALRDIVGGRLGLPAEVTRVLSKVVGERLTMISPAGLVEMCEVAATLADVPGDYAEAGTALGGSAILLAALKPADRELFVYDVFGQIPPPSDADGEDVHARYETIVAGEASGLGDDEYYGYQDDLIGKVTASFADCGYPVETSNVSLVQGLFEDTFHPTGPLALVHVDGDWYESTKVVLERALPHVSVGGVVLIDDYHHWSGCATAVDEVLGGREDFTRVDGHRVRFVRTA